MLTRDLVRIHIQSGVAHPRWVSPSSARDLQRAEQLIQVVSSYVGRTQGELDQTLKLETGQGRDFKLMRGLAKLLLDRADIDTTSPLEPRLVRETVFELATRHHPVSSSTRAEVIQTAANQLGAKAEDVERSLYADLSANQQIRGFDPIEPIALLHRYNVALIQGAMIRARALVIALPNPTPKRMRQLMRFLKFYRLLYSMSRHDDGSFVFKLDGPLSILKHSTRYGVALANFFPALLLCEEWHLVTDYQRAPRTRRGVLTLDSSMGFQSHYRDTGMWVAVEERALIDRMRELAHPWEVVESTELLDLGGQGAVVPDCVVRCPTSGKQAYIEIIWQWRKASLRSHYTLLRKAGPANLVVAVCSGKKAEGGAAPKLKGAVHTFKGVPSARALVKLAQQVAR